MLGRWEHVYGDDAAGFVAVFGEVFEVSCEGCRVAGDVDDLLWVQGDHGREELLVASASRRVHEDNVCAFSGVCHLAHENACIVVVETDIFDSVAFRICDRITHGVGIQFHADDFFCLVAGDQTDGSDSAVCIDHTSVSYTHLDVYKRQLS